VHSCLDPANARKLSPRIWTMAEALMLAAVLAVSSFGVWLLHWHDCHPEENWCCELRMTQWLSLLEGHGGRRRSATAAIRARHASPSGLFGLARGPVHFVQSIAKERSNFLAGTTTTTRQEDHGCFVSARAIADEKRSSAPWVQCVVHHTYRAAQSPISHH
jgi:hypothetical protein